MQKKRARTAGFTSRLRFFFCCQPTGNERELEARIVIIITFQSENINDKADCQVCFNSLWSAMHSLPLPAGITVRKITSTRSVRFFFCRKSDIVVNFSHFSPFFRLWRCRIVLFRGGYMSEHGRLGPDSDHVGCQPCRIRRALALVETNFAAKLSRKEMARAAGLSVSPLIWKPGRYGCFLRSLPFPHQK